MAGGDWSDERLDALRRVGDPRAATCLDALGPDGAWRSTQGAFAKLATNDAELPADFPAALAGFINEARDIGPLEVPRLDAAAEGYAAHAATGALCLLLSAIPQGYCAPNLSRVLHMTGLLDDRPHRRLLGVLQMVVDVMAPGGFGPTGAARMTGARLRLLHEGIRRMTRARLPDYEGRFGVPVCVEDMLGTLMGFSLLVVDGLAALGDPMRPDDAEEVWLLWRTFGRTLGIPEEHLPVDLADARSFYGRYAERHFAAAAENPEGLLLAQENLEMVRELIPNALQRLGVDTLPETLMVQLMGPSRAALLDVRAQDSSESVRDVICRWVLDAVECGDDGPTLGALHAHLSREVFRALIEKEYGGRPSIIIPASVRDLWKI